MKTFCAITYKISMIAEGIHVPSIIETLNDLMNERQSEYYTKKFCDLRKL